MTKKETKVEKKEKEVKKVSKTEIKKTKETSGKKASKKVTRKDKIDKKTKKRSKKYSKVLENFDKTKRYELEEAVKLAKETNYSKFGGSLELHIRLERKKNQQPVRAMVELPHGTGKKLNIVLLDDKKIEEIFKTKRINFDVALAKPEDMPKIGKIAKILGPKGKMPNPKSGTITNDPQKTIEEINSGKIEIKEEKNGLIHQLVGKIDWDDKKLLENIEKILNILPKTQIKNIVLSATMGPGVKVKI